MTKESGDLRWNIEEEKMGKIVMVASEKGRESQMFEFSGTTPEEMADKVALFMARRGYRLESGDKLQGVYGRGSSAGHAILGPFVHRQKYNVTIARKGDNVALVVAKGMSGWGGGALSAKQVTKEMQEILTELQSFILS